MRNFKFYKENNQWYVDLPEWKGEQAELEMVAGADSMLDIISQGEHETYVTLSVTPFENADVLELQSICSEQAWQLSGAFYKVSRLKGVSYDLSIWLCDVTTFVFGEFPKKIYIS